MHAITQYETMYMHILHTTQFILATYKISTNIISPIATSARQLHV